MHDSTGIGNISTPFLENDFTFRTQFDSHIRVLTSILVNSKIGFNELVYSHA